MAHIAKYEASALGNMCAHYSRTPEMQRGYKRKNIDIERTSLNFNLAPTRENGLTEFISKRIDELNLKRAPRKDAIRMCDCILTMPKSLDESRTREFFESGYRFLSSRYGRDNVVSAYVHMDESTPHMHFAWVPVTKDGRLSAKDVVTRADLRTLHKDMQQALEKDLNCKVEVLLDPEKVGEKQLSGLSQQEYVASKERLECLRQEIKEAEPAAESIAESLETLYKARNDGAREEMLAGEIESLKNEIRGYEERERKLDSDLSRLRKRVEQFAVRLRHTRERIVELVQSLTSIPDFMSVYTRSVAKKLGVPTYSTFSMEAMVEMYEREEVREVEPEIRDLDFEYRERDDDEWER